MTEVNIANLPSSVKIPDDLNQKFIDIGDRKVANQKVLEAAMQALYEQHVNFELLLADESKALWEQAFAATGVARDDSYSIDTKSKVMFKSTDLDAAIRAQTGEKINELVGGLKAALGERLFGATGDTAGASSAGPEEQVGKAAGGEQVQTMMDSRFDKQN